MEYLGRDPQQGAKTLFRKTLGGEDFFSKKKIRGGDFFEKN